MARKSGYILNQARKLALLIAWAPFHLIAICAIRIVSRFENFIRSSPFIFLFSLLLISSTATIFNPFNIEKRGDAASSNLLNNLISPFYPVRLNQPKPLTGRSGEKPTSRLGQSEITLVLIQQSTLDYFQTPFWPLSYGAQNEILDRIIQQGCPTAIFFDLYYSKFHDQDNRRTTDAADVALLKRAIAKTKTAPQTGNADAPEQAPLDTFVESLEQVNNGGLNPEKPCAPHIFLGRVSEGVKEFEAFRNFAANANGGRGAIVGLDVTKAPTIAYPIFAANVSGDGSITNFGKLQAAAAMYRAWCSTDQDALQRDKDCAKIDDWLFGDAPSRSMPLAVQWGYGTKSLDSRMPEMGGGVEDASDAEEINYSTKCDYTPRMFSRLEMFAARFLSALTFGVNEKPTNVETKCLYHTFIPAGALFGGLTPRQRRALFDGKIVMIGTDIPYLSDDYATPVYARAPGVAVHAMALDNLIEFGPNVARKPQEVIGTADFADIIALISIALCLLLIFDLHHRCDKTPDINVEKRASIVLGAAFYCSFLAAAIGCIGFHWPPETLLKIAVANIGIASVSEYSKMNKKTAPDLKTPPLERKDD